MEDKTFNGWTNRNTWTINMEYFADLHFEQMKEIVVQDSLKGTAHNCEWWVTMVNGDQDAEFMNEVDWEDLAETLLIDFKDALAYQ